MLCWGYISWTEIVNNNLYTYPKKKKNVHSVPTDKGGVYFKKNANKQFKGSVIIRANVITHIMNCGTVVLVYKLINNGSQRTKIVWMTIN